MASSHLQLVGSFCKILVQPCEKTRLIIGKEREIQIQLVDLNNYHSSRVITLPRNEIMSKIKIKEGKKWIYQLLVYGSAVLLA